MQTSATLRARRLSLVDSLIIELFRPLICIDFCDIDTVCSSTRATGACKAGGQKGDAAEA